jgi:chitinase
MINKFSTILIFSTIFILLLKGCVQPESSITSFDGNQSPVIKSVLLNPLFIKVGSTATINVDAEDPDGDALSYSWSTPLGDIIGSGPNVRYSAAYCCVGVNTVTVVVEDARGGKTSETINVEIIF